MVDTPERIWIYHNGNSQTYLTSQNKFHSVEYVRADIHAALEAENERLRKERDYWKVEAEGERAKVEYRDRKITRTEASAAVKVLREIRHLSRLDNVLSDGANAAVMSRMADIHQHADAALTTEPAAPQEAEAVTEAQVEAAAIAISGGRKDLWDSFDLFKRASFRTRALHALTAAQEASG